MTVREEIKDMNREASKQLAPGQVPQTMIMSPQNSSFARVGEGMRDLASALDSVSKFAQQKDEEQRETERIQGSIERRQGKAYDEVKKMGKYTGEGWQIADVEIRGSELMTSERQRIKTEFYGTKPAEYAQKHLKRIDNELATLGTEIRDPILKKHLLKQREKLLSTLAEDQTKAHIDYNYKKTVDSISHRINAVLDAAQSPEEMKVALEDARELMKPGRFKVAPADVDRALAGLIQYRYDIAETPTQLNIAMELEKMFATGRPMSVTGSGRASGSSSSSSGTGTGYMDAMEEDTGTPDSAGSSAGSSVEYRSPATRRSSVQSARTKAIERVQSNQRVGAALETENFRRLQSKEKTRALEGLWAKSMKEVYEDNPSVSEQDLVQAARMSYLQRLPATGAVDPKLKEAVGAYLYKGMDTSQPSDEATQVLEDLRVLKAHASPAYLDKYISPEDKNFVHRALSYGTLSAPEAIAKAAAVQTQIDQGIKFERPSATMIKEALKEMQEEASTKNRKFWTYFAPDIVYNALYGGDVNTAPTDAELQAGFDSPAGKMFATKLEKHAQQFLAETGSPQAALTRAIAERKPFTALIGAVPIMTESKTWAQLTRADARLFEDEPELLNQSVMELLDESAGYPALAGLQHDLKRGINAVNSGINKAIALVAPTGSTLEEAAQMANERPLLDVDNDYVGALGRGYGTLLGYIPDYSKLIIRVDEDAGTIRINQWNNDKTNTVSPMDIIIPTRLVGQRMETLYRNKRKIRDDLR